jgi:hypothetical protein
MVGKYQIIEGSFNISTFKYCSVKNVGTVDVREYEFAWPSSLNVECPTALFQRRAQWLCATENTRKEHAWPCL